MTGAGRGFCSGGDIKQDLSKDETDPERGTAIEQGFVRLRRFTEASRLLHEMPKPKIAMINGPVGGAGIGLAGACDLRFACESASFFAGFDRIGGSGDFGSTWHWTKILGSGAARELFLLGETIPAATALSRGIYTKVFPEGSLREETLKVATRLAAGPRMG